MCPLEGPYPYWVLLGPLGVWTVWLRLWAIWTVSFWVTIHLVLFVPALGFYPLFQNEVTAAKEKMFFKTTAFLKLDTIERIWNLGSPQFCCFIFCYNKNHRITWLNCFFRMIMLSSWGIIDSSISEKYLKKNHYKRRKENKSKK